MTQISEIKDLKVTKVYEELRSEVEKSIIKLEKKAKKLGVDAPEVILGETYIHTYTDSTYDKDDLFAEIEGNFKVFAVDVFDIEVKFKPIKFNGWTPIAFLDTVDQVYIQMDIDADYDYDFVKALEDKVCDHCKTRRNRRNVWVLQHEDGTIMKVGSTCIKDFTGVSPDSFFKMFQFIQSTIESWNDEEEMWRGSGKHRNPENYETFDIDNIFNITNNVINIDGSYIKSLYHTEEVYNGWKHVSIQIRSNEGESTVDKVKDVLYRQNNRIATDVENKYFITKSLDEKFIKGIREYLSQIEVRTTTGTREVYDENVQQYVEKTFIIENDFDVKLKSYADRKRTRRFGIGFICYIVESYNIYLESLTSIKSEHVGTVGEKQVIEVTVQSVRSINTDFGLSNIYKMIDSDGNIFTKFGTIAERFITNNTDKIEEGTVLKMYAEIKGHNEYKGNKETLIGRVSNVPKLKKVK
jgi:hypothetical protein